jgi:hypothetical protein
MGVVIEICIKYPGVRTRIIIGGLISIPNTNTVLPVPVLLYRTSCVGDVTSVT